MALRIRHRTREEPAVEPGRTSHPLFWLLVLAAMLAIVWSIYNRYASQATPAKVRPESTAPANRPVSRVVLGQPFRPLRTSRTQRP